MEGVKILQGRRESGRIGRIIGERDFSPHPLLGRFSGLIERVIAP
jgi:hypothetical protein